MSRLTRRLLIAGLLAVPVSSMTVAHAGAQGKGGGSGNGNGGGAGNGNNGNGRGNGGSSNAGGGGKGKGNSKGGGASATTGGANADQSKSPSDSVDPGAAIGTTRPASLRIRHDNGFEEALARGRYTMKDNRGRTIVNRTAGPSDYERLRRLAGN